MTSKKPENLSAFRLFVRRDRVETYPLAIKLRNIARQTQHSDAPSPLVGEDRGEGATCHVFFLPPHPNPLPRRGEGIDYLNLIAIGRVETCAVVLSCAVQFISSSIERAGCPLYFLVSAFTPSASSAPPAAGQSARCRVGATRAAQWRFPAPPCQTRPDRPAPPQSR